jgi:iron complex outermembrane recepter protein
MKIYRVIPLSLCAVFALANEAPIQKAQNEIAIEYKRSTKDADIAVKQISSSDTASLFSDVPGVSINSGGGMSNIPAIHGLADDRIKILVDGMPLTSTCPNHMNTPLSYIDPKRVETIGVVAGITPVSKGGDSIAGTIIAESAKPVFATAGKGMLNSGELSGFFRSNNVNRGALISLTTATENFSFNYTGSSEKAGNYQDGAGEKVKATLYEQRNQFVTVAHQSKAGLFTAQVGQQTAPYQGYANEYMDMLSDKASFINLSYLGYIGESVLDARAFWKKSEHYMNKILSERTGNMPMDTKGTELGYAVKIDVPLSSRHIVKVGNDFHRYSLDDWWPAAMAMLGGMGPNTFWNINNGHRDVFGLFAESNYKWNEKLTTNIGIRTDIVRMNTGNVDGYNSTINDGADSTAFNAKDHAKQDNNYDITASTQYKNSATNDLEFGVSRKTRSPNIHERYSWAGGYQSAAAVIASAPIAMDMAMVNWFGDGNGYVGNIDLKPEVAYTVSATSAWREVGNKDVGIKVTPYYTLVKDYIDADYIGTATGAGSYKGIKLFRFANHDAVLFGADASANAKVWDNDSLGKGSLKGVLGYTRGYRTDGGSSLYHIMPLNAKVSLEQKVGLWTNGIDVQAVASKEQVSSVRNEPITAGYALVDLRTNYQWSKLVKIDFAVTNLLNKSYDLPLGGINTITSVKTSSAKDALNGQGRSFNTAVSIKF